MKLFLTIFVTTCIFLLLPKTSLSQHEIWLNVKDFGAIADGSTLNTVNLQKAIDKASKEGRTLLIPSGVYLTGSLHLRSNLSIHLEPNAIILGSQKVENYDPYEELGFPNDADKETSFFHHSLMWGEDVENIVITGYGVIDSNFTQRGGPKTLAFKRCKNIKIEGITIRNSPNYAISLLGCSQVIIDKVQILNAHADGIDPDCCQFVFISNCRIESFDDAIVPKSSFSLGYRLPCTDIVVTNCYLSTKCNGFKLGTESGSDFKRITVSNCVIKGFGDGHRPVISGVALESVDGGNIEGVTISNITMEKVRTPLFIRLGNRGRDNAPGPGSIKGITISNIIATKACNPNIIAGIPGHYVEDVLIENIHCSFIGAPPLRSVTEPVPEEESRYPEALMFGALPSYAFFIRHAKNIMLNNISFSGEENFWRIKNLKFRETWWNEDGIPINNSEPSTPGLAFYLEDVDGFKISQWREKANTTESPLIYLKCVKNARIDTPLHTRETVHWCTIAGKDNTNIEFTGNILTKVGKHIKICDEKF
ncbi:MAG: glycoside hydrolase family 28 protein [Candidatus Hydrogenedentes bacterium]|nr:glycoside hydrolase family 28 protein [Candidatus Hydrogenedentota bacterium]